MDWQTTAVLDREKYIGDKLCLSKIFPFNFHEDFWTHLLVKTSIKHFQWIGHKNIVKKGL